MILIIWHSEKANEYARSIEHGMQEQVEVAATLHEGCERLRASEYSVVLIDQWIPEAEPEPTSLVFNHLGMAIPVFVNFGISGVERILREIRAALSRRGLESVLAHDSARQKMEAELRDDVTALLLSCGVALREPELNDAIKLRLEKIEQLAEHMKEKLAIANEGQAAAAGI